MPPKIRAGHAGRSCEPVLRSIPTRSLAYRSPWAIRPLCRFKPAPRAYLCTPACAVWRPWPATKRPPRDRNHRPRGCRATLHLARPGGAWLAKAKPAQPHKRGERGPSWQTPRHSRLHNQTLSYRGGTALRRTQGACHPLSAGQGFWPADTRMPCMHRLMAQNLHAGAAMVYRGSK